MAKTVVYTVTFTIKGTPEIERYSTKAQAEQRAAEVRSTYNVPVRVLA